MEIIPTSTYNIQSWFGHFATKAFYSLSVYEFFQFTAARWCFFMMPSLELWTHTRRAIQFWHQNFLWIRFHIAELIPTPYSSFMSVFTAGHDCPDKYKLSHLSLFSLVVTFSMSVLRPIGHKHGVNLFQIWPVASSLIVFLTTW